MPQSWETWTVAGIAALFVGMGKAGFGGLGMVAVLLMAEIMPARESTGLILPMLIAADICAAYVFRKEVSWPDVCGLLPPAAVGIVIGWLLMPHIPDRFFGPMIGWMSLAFSGILIARPLIGELVDYAAEHPAAEWVFGCLAGITTMLANAAGPIMTIYLLARRFPKMRFVSTAAWYFLAINAAKVPFSAGLGLITGPSLLVNAKLLPAIVAGIAIGRILLGLIPQRPYEWVLLAFTIAAAIRLIVR